MADKVKRRIGIAVSEDLDSKLQRIADAYGVPKATLCTMWVAQAAAGADLALNSIQGMTENLAIEMMKEGKAAAEAESLEG